MRELQSEAIQQKVTMQLREGIKITFIVGSIKEIQHILEHQKIEEHSTVFWAPPPPPPEIHDREFYECKYILNIEVNDICERIGAFAFYNCTNLESIYIGKNIKVIAVSAFEGCRNLTQITYNGTKKQWKNIRKESDWDTNTGKYKVICTDGTLSKSGS